MYKVPDIFTNKQTLNEIQLMKNERLQKYKFTHAFLANIKLANNPSYKFFKYKGPFRTFDKLSTSI